MIIAVQFISWYFLEVPGKILRAWKNFLKFNIKYFSIPLLVKTFFAPWRRYRWAYPKGFDIGRYVEIFFSNLISIILGMIMKTMLILIGLLIEALIFLIGIVLLIGWFVLPLLLLVELYFGLVTIL